MRHLILLSLTFFLTVVALGCGVGKPVLVNERPEIVKLAETERQPIDCQVRMIPAVISVTGSEESENPYAAHGDVEALDIDGAIAEVLADFQVFAEVLPQGEAGQPYFDIQCEVSKYQLTYEGRNSVYLPNLLFVWGWSPWTSWKIADEDYAASLSVKFSVNDAETGGGIWDSAIKAEVVEALDDYQRGTKWFSIFKLGKLTSENWKLVETTLRPHITEELKAKLIEQLLSTEVQAVLSVAAERIKARRLPESDLAVVVGINSCAQLGERQPKWCKESARKLAQVLRKAGYEVVNLQGAKIADIKAAIEKTTLQTDYRIRRLLFYYAGVGASQYVEGENVVQHYIFGSGEKMLSLVELAELLNKTKAQERVVILDTGFALDSLGRGIRLSKIPQGVTLGFPEELASGSFGFLSACGPGQGAAEDSEFETCLFTHYMLRALSSPATDANGDGTVTLQEIISSEPVSFDLVRRSKLNYGTLQTPVLGTKYRETAVIGNKKE